MQRSPIFHIPGDIGRNNPVKAASEYNGNKKQYNPKMVIRMQDGRESENTGEDGIVRRKEQHVSHCRAASIIGLYTHIGNHNDAGTGPQLLYST